MNKHCYGVAMKINGKNREAHPIPLPVSFLRAFSEAAIRFAKVQSVCVFDAIGTACHYVKKTPAGIYREVRKPLTGKCASL